MQVPEAVRFAKAGAEIIEVPVPFQRQGLDEAVAVWRGWPPGKPQTGIIPQTLPATRQLTGACYIRWNWPSETYSYQY